MVRSLFPKCLDSLEDLQLTDHQKENIVFLLSLYEVLVENRDHTIDWYKKKLVGLVQEKVSRENREWWDKIILAVEVENKSLLPPDLHADYDLLAGPPKAAPAADLVPDLQRRYGVLPRS